MQATNTVIKMNRKAPRINTKADYSGMTIEGRKGRPNTRQRRNMRDVKRNWEEV